VPVVPQVLLQLFFLVVFEEVKKMHDDSNDDDDSGGGEDSEILSVSSSDILKRPLSATLRSIISLFLIVMLKKSFLL
jgi:hypothetical protein